MCPGGVVPGPQCGDLEVPTTAGQESGATAGDGAPTMHATAGGPFAGFATDNHREQQWSVREVEEGALAKGNGRVYFSFSRTLVRTR